MTSPADIALKKIEKVLARDPVLRDVLSRNLPRSGGSTHFTPDIDVVEIEDRYVILVDVPGVARESLSVELDGTRLIVSGIRPSRHPHGARPKVVERGTGEFRREFLLPALVDGNGVTAKLADGVLRIEVPRAATHGPVKVEVAEE
jgi:HSP20 family protein